jgi:hypothetical protein
MANAVGDLGSEQSAMMILVHSCSSSFVPADVAVGTLGVVIAVDLVVDAVVGLETRIVAEERTRRGW